MRPWDLRHLLFAFQEYQKECIPWIRTQPPRKTFMSRKPYKPAIYQKVNTVFPNILREISPLQTTLHVMLKKTSFSNACFWHDLAFWDLTTVEMRPRQKQYKQQPRVINESQAYSPLLTVFPLLWRQKRGDDEQRGGQEYKTAET